MADPFPNGIGALMRKLRKVLDCVSNEKAVCCFNLALFTKRTQIFYFFNFFNALIALAELIQIFTIVPMVNRLLGSEEAISFADIPLIYHYKYSYIFCMHIHCCIDFKICWSLHIQFRFTKSVRGYFDIDI